MGVTPATRFGFLLLASPLLVFALPKLRLENTVVGPVSVAAGAVAAAQVLEAYNAGDGSLRLAVSSNAAWVNPSVGAPRNCSSRPGSCIPITMAFATASLVRGVHTATVTVGDPSALDAPQFVLVTVQVGGGVPDQIELFAAPNGSSDEVLLRTNRPLDGLATTQSGGQWLSFALDGLGTFRFVLPYRVTARHLAGMAAGVYTGAVTTASSGFPPDSKRIPVTFRVTSQPILQPNPGSLRVRIAQTAVRQQRFLFLSNRGQGTLNLTAASATTAAGGNWLTAEKVAGADIVALTLVPTGLAPGIYQGNVRFTSNAGNPALAVEMVLEVVPAAAPVGSPDGVVNNATFEGGDVLGKGVIAAIFGEQFTLRAPRSASALPLTTEMDGVRVFVNDRPAPVYFVSYGQVNLQVPYETESGEVVVRVDRDGQRGNNVAVRITDSAPRILRLGIGDYGIIVNQDQTFPIPATPGIPSRPARPGDALVIYVIGAGPTSPPVASGAAAPLDPLAMLPFPTTVVFGGGVFAQGVQAQPFFFGLTPDFVGLYQVNVIVPVDTPKGDNVPVYLEGGGIRSNTVRIVVQ